jgi:hypothetical protein
MREDEDPDIDRPRSPTTERILEESQMTEVSISREDDGELGELPRAHSDSVYLTGRDIRELLGLARLWEKIVARKETALVQTGPTPKSADGDPAVPMRFFASLHDGENHYRQIRRFDAAGLIDRVKMDPDCVDTLDTNIPSKGIQFTAKGEELIDRYEGVISPVVPGNDSSPSDDIEQRLEEVESEIKHTKEQMEKISEAFHRLADASPILPGLHRVEYSQEYGIKTWEAAGEVMAQLGGVVEELVEEGNENPDVSDVFGAVLADMDDAEEGSPSESMDMDDFQFGALGDSDED